MLGLIKKDLFMAKGNFKTIAIIFVVFTFTAINGNENFAFIPAFMSVMIMMSTFSYDEYNKTDAFISTLPNGKKNAIKSKYAATLFIVFISVILTFIVCVAVGYAKNSLNMEYIISTTIGCCVGVILLQSIIYPVIFKYGIEKSRIGIFVGVFGITGIVAFLTKSGYTITIPQHILVFLNNYWMVIIPLITIMILFLSYKISEHLYCKKEF